MRGALEAARMREEQLRVNAEQASKERDELCWRWNEDAGVWRRREAEVRLLVFTFPLCSVEHANVASGPNTPPCAAASSVRSCCIVSGATGVELATSDVTTRTLVPTFTTPRARSLSAPSCDSGSEFCQCAGACASTADFAPTWIWGTYLRRFIFGLVTLVMVWHGIVCSESGS